MDAPIIATIIVTLIAAVLGSGGMWSYLTYRQQRRDNRANNDNRLEQAMRALLRNEIVKIYRRVEDAEDKGKHLDMAEYANPRGLYDAYCELGGNGPITKMWERIDNHFNGYRR